MTPALAAIGLVAEDLPRTLAFYRTLGLAIPEGAETEAHVEVTLPNGLRVMWDTVEVIAGFDPAWTRPTGGHRAALAFECTSSSEVDEHFSVMTAAGFDGHVEPWDAFWGQRYAVLHDPDGTSVELFAALA
jgi:uncharacterized glyoxalase superfamily protein PhnB